MSDKATTVEVTPEELKDILGSGPSADSILLQEDQTKPNFFSSKGVDNLSFIGKKEPKKVEKVDKTDKTDDPDKVIAPPKDQLGTGTLQKDKEVTPEEVKTLLDGKEDKEDIVKGRPKVSKDAAIELTKKLIEEGTLIPFDDDKKLEDYTVSDIEELFKANLKDKEDQIKARTPVEFFDSLPLELQQAAKYVAEGGTDLKGLFRALSDIEQTRALSEEIPEDQEAIAREYLAVTNFGTAEDIAEEVNSWKDLGKLAEKAEKFKPRLEKMRAEQLQYKLTQAETLRKQREEAAAKYQNSVYETLKPAKLGTLTLDKKTQGMLYNGLTAAQYPSISGRATNQLGHLLEKYQFVEPNHALIAEALWLLSDPEGYRTEVKKQAKEETTEKIVRKLKTEETRKISSSSAEDKDEDTRSGQRKIARDINIFKR